MSYLESSDTVAIGKLGRPHGVCGEIRCCAYGDGWPEWADEVTLVMPDGTQRACKVQKARPGPSAVILSLSEMNSRNEAQRWTHAEVHVADDAVPLPDEDEAYLHEVIGWRVVDSEGTFLGHVRAFSSNGAQDLAVMEGPQGQERLFPWLSQTLRHFDRKARTVEVIALEGLWGDDAPIQKKANKSRKKKNGSNQGELA